MISIERLLEQTADGAFAVDSTLRIVAWNKAATHILGYEPRAVIGQPCYRILAGRDDHGDPVCDQNCAPLRCAHRGHLQPHYEVRATTAQGTPAWLDVTIITLSRRDGGPAQLVHIFRRIDRQKSLEAFVRQAVEIAADHLPRAASPPHDGASRLATLSRRERQVLEQLRRGRSTRQIAHALEVSETTVRTHTQHVLEKLGVHSRMAAVLLAERHTRR